MSQPAVLAAAVVLLGIAHTVWRWSTAKNIAEQWLEQHHYRTKSLRTAWFGAMLFAPALLRSSRNAFVFLANVDDKELGGTGELGLRVWLTFFGAQNGDVETAWKRMPEGGDIRAEPLMERLADAQISVLRRVAAGETAFYAPRHPDESQQREFDELVEHVLALSARGMLTHGAPVTDGRPGSGYESIGSLGLTQSGRAWLESQSTETETA